MRLGSINSIIRNLYLNLTYIFLNINTQFTHKKFHILITFEIFTITIADIARQWLGLEIIYLAHQTLTPLM